MISVYTSIFGKNIAGNMGGAIKGSFAPITTKSSTFDKNIALGGVAGFGNGAHLFAEPTTISIFETTFEPFEPSKRAGESVHVAGALGGCSENPCSPGFACSYEKYSLSCTVCSTGTVSTGGIQCLPCPASTQPNESRIACESCVGTTYSTTGTCENCDAPNIVDSDHKSCTACPAGTAPNQARTACVDCVGATYSAFGVACTTCAAPNVVAVSTADGSVGARIGCAACAAGNGRVVDNDGAASCAACTGTTYSLDTASQYPS